MRLRALFGPKAGILVALVNLWLMSGILLFGSYFAATRLVAITSGLGVLASAFGMAALSSGSARVTIVCAYVLNVLLWLFGIFVVVAAIQELFAIGGIRLTTILGTLLLLPATGVIVSLVRRRVAKTPGALAG